MKLILKSLSEITTSYSCGRCLLESGAGKLPGINVGNEYLIMAPGAVPMEFGLRIVIDDEVNGCDDE